MTVLALLPLFHFALAPVSLLEGRLARRLSALAVLVDAALVGWLLASIAGGGDPGIVMGEAAVGLGIRLVADPLTIGFTLLTLLIEGALVAYLWSEAPRAYFYTLLHLLFGAVFSTLFTRDLFNIFVTLELLTLVSFLLVGYERKARQVWASLKYLVLASLGMSRYLIGVALIYYHTGTLDLDAIAAGLPPGPAPRWVWLGSALLLSGIAVKSGVFLFSIWLPEAHARAHSAVSALLSGLVIKMGIVVLIRLAAAFPVSVSLQVLGAVTGILGLVYAITTHDLKRMLAYSTLSQLGYVILGVGIGTAASLTAAGSYAVAHGLFKGLLFLAAGTAIREGGFRDIAPLIAQRGRVSRGVRLALLVGTLGIVGLPPLAGFAAKSLLTHATAALPVQGVMFLMSLGTAAAFAKLGRLLWPGKGAWGSATANLSFIVLGLPVLLFLPLAWPVLPRALAAAGRSPVPYAESLAAIVGGYLLHRWIRRRPRRALPQRFLRLEEGVMTILSGFFLVLILVWLQAR